jgi:hypothetical protein
MACPAATPAGKAGNSDRQRTAAQQITVAMFWYGNHCAFWRMGLSSIGISAPSPCL